MQARFCVFRELGLPLIDKKIPKHQNLISNNKKPINNPKFFQLQGKADQREAANVPVIGKSNQPAASNTQNSTIPNNKPSNEPSLLLANSLFSANQQQPMNGLFPQMPIDCELSVC
jgi:hypothetical protein